MLHSTILLLGAEHNFTARSRDGAAVEQQLRAPTSPQARNPETDTVCLEGGILRAVCSLSKASSNILQNEEPAAVCVAKICFKLGHSCLGRLRRMCLEHSRNGTTFVASVIRGFHEESNNLDKSGYADSRKPPCKIAYLA